jgi:hypothetical protein
MKKVVEYKTNLSKKELKDLMKEVILEKYKEDYSKMIAIAQMYEEELKNEKSH